MPETAIDIALIKSQQSLLQFIAKDCETFVFSFHLPHRHLTCLSAPAFIHVNRNFSHALSRISKKKYMVVAGNFTDFIYRLNHTGFIVGVHDRNQNGCWPE